jgi:hypothetical protein
VRVRAKPCLGAGLPVSIGASTAAT